MYQSVQDDMTEYRAPLLQQPDGRREEKSKAAKEDPHELSSGCSLHQRRNENLQKIERFSMLCKVSIAISVLALAIAIGFITWLWWVDRDDYFFRYWALAPNRVQLSIAIAGVVIRAAMGTIAASVTSMIASLAVERRGVRLHAIAQISAVRFMSGGPASLAPMALRNCISEPLIRIFFIGFVLSNIGAQFTSTLLLADLNESRMVSFPRHPSDAYRSLKVVNKTYSFRFGQSQRSKNDWQEPPYLSETFAEYAGIPVTDEGIDDTGSTIRAFLPLSSAQAREKLQEFRGTTRVVESGVTCVRPEVTNLSFCHLRKNPPSISLCGTARVDGLTLEKFLGAEPASAGTDDFACLLLPFVNPEQVWQVCPLDIGANWTKIDHMLEDSSDPPLRRLFLFWDAGNFMHATSSENERSHRLHRRAVNGTGNNTIQSVLSSKENMWLKQTFNVTRLFQLLMEEASNAFGTPRDLLLSEEEQRRMNSYSNIRMTICTGFDEMTRRFSTKNLKLVATRTRPRAEPVFTGPIYTKPAFEGAEFFRNTGWNLDATHDVRVQLGAASNSTTPEDRQIMHISPDSLKASLINARNRVNSAEYGEVDELAGGWLYDHSLDEPLSFCPNCGPHENMTQAHSVYANLLNAVMNDTGSPARALQAVYFTKARMMYHRFISFFPPTVNENITITTFEVATVPVNRRGYWIIMAIITVFAVISTSVCILFRTTDFSIPNNAWHTIAQMSESAEISSIPSRSKLKTDGQVLEFSKELQDEDEEDRFVVRNGAFVRASSFSTARDKDTEA